MVRVLSSWRDLARRTWDAVQEDDIFGLSAQLAFYVFLSLFPALLFLIAFASFFPLSDVTDEVSRVLGPFVSPQLRALVEDQMQRLANNADGGLLTFGVAGALWSSSAALNSIVGALNLVYDVKERRRWWTVRLVAMGLTLGVAVLIVVAFSLVLGGAALAAWLGRVTGLGTPFEWAWFALQWPFVFALVVTAIGLIYRFAPNVKRRWGWIAPGAIAATVLWMLVSLGFKVYIARFTDYEGAYGAVGGVIVVLLWFYVSGIAILSGAELNAVIERAALERRPTENSARGPGVSR